jgi:hypothetical protein
VGYESCFGDSLTVSAMHATPGLRDFAVKQTIRFCRSYSNDAIRNQTIWKQLGPPTLEKQTRSLGHLLPRLADYEVCLEFAHLNAEDLEARLLFTCLQ